MTGFAAKSAGGCVAAAARPDRFLSGSTDPDPPDVRGAQGVGGTGHGGIRVVRGGADVAVLRVVVVHPETPGKPSGDGDGDAAIERVARLLVPIAVDLHVEPSGRVDSVVRAGHRP